ncbi:hypothetical protein JW921_09290 [Candidatus Fermentibacterales bacterium]|nr:hypothetical protein [Candidatus Fermentibacterales bacterium]
MRVGLLCLLALALAASLALAGGRGGGDGEEGRDLTVAIELTEDQVKAVTDSRSGSVRVRFTDEQLEILVDAVPEFAFDEVTLEPTHVSASGVVVLGLHVPDSIVDPRSDIEMNPQPSP